MSPALRPSGQCMPLGWLDAVILNCAGGSSFLSTPQRVTTWLDAEFWKRPDVLYVYDLPFLKVCSSCLGISFWERTSSCFQVAYRCCEADVDVTVQGHGPAPRHFERLHGDANRVVNGVLESGQST